MPSIHEETMPKNRAWTAEDEITANLAVDNVSGRSNLVLGLHWYLWGVIGWLLTGHIYVILLFATPQCHSPVLCHVWNEGLGGRRLWNKRTGRQGSKVFP